MLLTQDTVRNTDDALYHPDEVIYDEETHTARLLFSSDINELGPDDDENSGVGLAGGTFRLRIGTAVDERVDLIIPLEERGVAPSVATDLGVPGVRVTFEARLFGESESGRLLSFEDSGAGGLNVFTEAASELDTIVVDLGGDTPTIADLKSAIEATPAIDALISMRIQGDDTQELGPRLVGAPPLSLVAVGDTLETALLIIPT